MAAVKLGDAVDAAMQDGIDQFSLHEIHDALDAAGTADGEPRHPADLFDHDCLGYTDSVAAGRLQTILSAYPPPELGIYVMLPSNRQIPYRVRRLIDFLAQRLGRD